MIVYKSTSFAATVLPCCLAVRFTVSILNDLELTIIQLFAHSMQHIVKCRMRVFSLHICWMSSNRKRIKTVLIKRNWNCIDVYGVPYQRMDEWTASTLHCASSFLFLASFRSGILRYTRWIYLNWFPLKASHVSPFNPPRFSKCIQLNPERIYCASDAPYKWRRKLMHPSLAACIL